MSLRIGLVGCGHISAAHLRGWRKARACRVAGVLDLDRQLADRRAREFGVARVYDELDELMEECDVVDVCSPPATHAEIALRAIQHGRHLLVEKPLVVDLGEWEALLEALRDSPSVVTVVHNIRFAWSVRTARRWLDEGRIGALLRLNRQFLTSPERDRMLGGDAHWSHRLPGGRWLETLPHELYLIHHFAGALDLRGVVAVRTPDAPGGVRADEVLLSFAGERCIATVEYSANCRVNRRALTLHGTLGRIEIDLLSGALALSTFRDSRWLRAVGGPYLEAGTTVLRALPQRAGYLARRLRGMTPHAELIRALARHLHGQGPPPTPRDEIDYVIRKSAEIGEAIERQIEA